MRSATVTNKRCSWVSVDDPLLLQYHDREWGVPVHNDRKHFEVLALSGVQAGLSWSLVLKKRGGYRRAFNQFDPEKVAHYSEREIRKLTADPEIIRNRMKIEAAVRNACAFLKIQEEFGSFDSYCWRFVNGRPKLNRWKATRQISRTSRSCIAKLPNGLLHKIASREHQENRSSSANHSPPGKPPDEKPQSHCRKEGRCC